MRSAVLLAVVAVLSGCGGPDAAVQRSVSANEGALEGFWRSHTEAFGARSWQPPRHVVTYSESHPPDSACHPRWKTNAVYCAADRSLYVDGDWLPSFGRAFAQPRVAELLVQAEAFGHHLQALAPTRPRSALASELQAACYAGVFLRAAADGHTSLRLATIDVPAALDTLRDIGSTDASEANWLAGGAQGGPIVRSAAVAAGYQDAALCAGYAKATATAPWRFADFDFYPPPAARSQVIPSYGRFDKTDVRYQDDELNGLTLDMLDVTGLGRGRDVLRRYLPQYFEGSTVRYVGAIRPLNVVMKGYAAASQRYRQQTVNDGVKTVAHGTLVLVWRPDGTGLTLDAYRDGADGDWSRLDAYALAAVWGIAN